MSGHSSTTVCPNCGNEANLYSDYKPFDIVVIDCLHCGFYTTTESNYYSLGDLNIMREEYGMEPLESLPKQEFEIDAHNESRYFLFGEEACRIYDEENGNVDAEYFKKRWIGYSVYEYKGNPVDMLSQANGWDDFCEITKQEYESLKK